VYKGKLEDGTQVIIKVQETSDAQPAWRAVWEVQHAAKECTGLVGAEVLSVLTCKHCCSQLYVHACSSAPPHPNVCQLIGWGIKGRGPTLDGLMDGNQVYMVQEFAGEELQKTIDDGGTVPPAMAYNYLVQLAQGADICATATESSPS
jgi:hypothetical protein